ncbi:S1 family peptidase [Ferruginibacter profundus]
MRYYLLICFFIFSNVSFAQNDFSQDWLKCIVELQKPDSAGTLKTHGTGFCIYNYSGGGFTYLVTCAHVLRNPFIYVRIPASDSATVKLGKTKTDLSVKGRKWVYDGFSFTTKLDLIKNKNFVVDDSLDIGVIKLSFYDMLITLNKDTTKLISFTSIGNSRIRKKADVEVGTNIYFVGFPLGIGSASGYYGAKLFSDVKINPLVRSGIVAWKSEEINTFLVDGVSYSGNSGSPIFTQGDLFGKYQPSLIGIVLGHLSDPTVTGVDINQGLVRCLWIDDILKLKDNLK